MMGKLPCTDYDNFMITNYIITYGVNTYVYNYQKRCMLQCASCRLLYIGHHSLSRNINSLILRHLHCVVIGNSNHDCGYDLNNRCYIETETQNFVTLIHHYALFQIMYKQ